ncbi:hypothetical protein MKW94_014112 [Papaver nudicaule]|uniref:Uncharacterized protein n=1 Tax=Papaver nudicaule TaxID=74823 RepID=A0AA41SAI9_PAPNU|nr:hypothetical protein [Papaver nudicaule]
MQDLTLVQSLCESILQSGSNCNVRIEKNGLKKKEKRRKNSSVPPQNSVVYACNFCSHRNLKRGTSKNHMKEILPPRPKKVKSDEKRLNLVKPKADECKLDMNVEAIVCPENVSGLKEDGTAQICSGSDKAIESNTEIGQTAEELVPAEFIPIEISEAKAPDMNPVIGNVDSEKSLATPSNKTRLLLLDSKRRKRTKSHNKQVATESNSTTTDAEKVSTNSNKRRRKSLKFLVVAL